MIHHHTDFWSMARATWDYCRRTGMSVVSQDNREKRLCGFVTDCDEDDPRRREWEISLADASLTANHRYGGFNGLSEEEMIQITHPHLSNPEGRKVVARSLSAGQPEGTIRFE